MGELRAFLKGHIQAEELYKDPNFLPANHMGGERDPNVIGVYAGKEFVYIGDSKYVRPKDGEMPPILPHRQND